MIDPVSLPTKRNKYNQQQEQEQQQQEQQQQEKKHCQHKVLSSSWPSYVRAVVDAVLTTGAAALITLSW